MPKKEWAAFSEEAHLISFGEHKPKEWDRIDYALVADREDTPLLWVTCRETDESTLYWGYGGAFPSARETSLSFLGYQALVNHSKEKYSRIWTIIKNDNFVMLKFAMKVGFKVIGVRCMDGEIMLEMLWEKSQNVQLT